MTSAKLRLIIAAILFVSWLGYLGFLAFQYSRPVIVSRSQMMLATHAAEARVFVENDLPARVEILRFLGKTSTTDEVPTEKVFAIEDLRLARQANEKPLQNEGVYLLPLAKLDATHFVLVRPPRSPGNEGFDSRPLVYAYGPEVEKQARDLLP